MDSTYADFGPTLFPRSDDMTIAPQRLGETRVEYNDWDDSEVESVYSVYDRLWDKVPASPYDQSALYADEEEFAEGMIALFEILEHDCDICDGADW